MKRFVPCLAASALISVLSIAAACAAPVGGAHPQFQMILRAGYDQTPQDEAYRARKAGRIVALEKIVQSLERRFGGHILNSRLDGQAAPPTYAIRWLSADGRRLDILVDASNGQVLDVR